MSLGGERYLLVGRPAVLERSKRDQHGPRVAGMALRRERERFADGSTAVGARPVEPRHQLRRPPVRVHAKDLENRRRAADLPAHGVAVADAVRGRKPGIAVRDGSRPTYYTAACARMLGSDVAIRTAFFGSW